VVQFWIIKPGSKTRYSIFLSDGLSVVPVLRNDTKSPAVDNQTSNPVDDASRWAESNFTCGVMFAVIGFDYKSKLLFVEGTINADKYVENLANLGLGKEVDEKLDFQQDGVVCYVIVLKESLIGLKNTVT
jgi:hypothetical protein